MGLWIGWIRLGVLDVMAELCLSRPCVIGSESQITTIFAIHQSSALNQSIRPFRSCGRPRRCRNCNFVFLRRSQTDCYPLPSTYPHPCSTLNSTQPNSPTSPPRRIAHIGSNFNFDCRLAACLPCSRLPRTRRDWRASTLVARVSQRRSRGQPT
jgi:hypothetical protein